MRGIHLTVNEALLLIGKELHRLQRQDAADIVEVLIARSEEKRAEGWRYVRLEQLRLSPHLYRIKDEA